MSESTKQITIGGSDVAAILGVSRFRTRLDVALAKTGDWEQPSTEAMAWGNRLEREIATEAARRLSMQSADESWLGDMAEYAGAHERGLEFRHPECPWAVAHVDDVISPPGEPDPMHVLEVKNVGWRKGWGESWSDEFPEEYRLQIQFYLWVTGLDVGYLAALFGGNELRTYRVERNDRLIGVIVDHCRAFVEMLERGELPDPQTPAEVHALWQRAEEGETRMLTASQTDNARFIHEKYREACDALKKAEARKDEIRTKMMEFHRDGDRVFRHVLDADGKRLSTATEVAYTTLDAKACAKDNPELIEKYPRHVTYLTCRQAKVTE